MPLSVAAAKKPPNNWAIAHLPLFSIVQTHDHHDDSSSSFPPITIIKNRRHHQNKKLPKQEHKVSYRCSLPSPLHKRSKDCKGLGGSASFELLSFPQLWQEVSKLSENFLPKPKKT